MDLSNFHPSDIQLNYSLPGSSDYYVVTFAMLDSQTRYVVNYSVVHGCTIAASFSFLVLLVLIIRNKSTPIFILNQIILMVSIMRSALFLAYQLGPLGSLEVAFTAFVDYRYRDCYKYSVATNAMLIILVTLIQLSFAYQTWIIFKSPEVKKYRFILIGVFTALICTTFGFYANNATASTKQYKALTNDLPVTYPAGWVKFVPQILFSASINFMSLILVLKLVFAIRTRRYLGLKQFSYYHIMLIMFSSTLVIPTVLTICTYAISRSYIYSDILTHISISLTALLLPFTSLWASLANNSRNISSSALVYLTSSNNSGNSGNSGYSSGTSPIDEKTLNIDDNYSFFPEKLNELKSNQSINSAHSKPTLADLNYSPDTIPNDILQIIKDEDDSAAKKHFSSISNDSFDKLDTDILVEATYNHRS